MWNRIYEAEKEITLSQINDVSLVKAQYADTKNLNTRISIHEKYSINKMGFNNWIVSNYQIKENMKILELGCGTGDIWNGRETVIRACSQIGTQEPWRMALGSTRSGRPPQPCVRRSLHRCNP